jgi:hypothetical protein
MKNNPITKLFNALSDEDILAVLNEIVEAEKTGQFGLESKIRELAKECNVITRTDVSANLLMVQINVLKEGAMRWVKLKEIEDAKKKENGTDTTTEE